MKLSKERFELFKEFVETVAVSGHENNMLKLLKEKYEPLCDELLYDNLGSIVAHKKSKAKDAPKVLVLAHMDEVGLHVKGINADGSLAISDVRGSIWEQTLSTSRVYIQTRDNKLINGVIGSIPPHLLNAETRNKPFAIEQMTIDIGTKSIEETKALGINMFDPIVVRGDLEELGDGERLLGKAFDDRIGCICGYEVLKELSKEDLDIDLYIGNSVQEELGCIGAGTITEVIKPDFCIILDVSPSDDLGHPNATNGKIGEGVLLRVCDGSMIAVSELIQYQERIAHENNAKVQYYISRGGTDAGMVHRRLDGVLTLTNCICARSIHTNATVIDLNDYEDCKKIVLAILRDLNKTKIEGFKPINRI